MNPTPYTPMPGALRIDFEAKNRELLVEQWGSEKVSWQLRATILIAASIFAEQGSPNLIVRRLLGNDDFEREEISPFSSGIAAEVSLHSFPHMRLSRLSGPHDDLTVSWVARRINQVLFYGPGPREVAQYGAAHGLFDRMVLSVPRNGLQGDSLCLWHQFGNVGRFMPARKKILVNE